MRVAQVLIKYPGSDFNWKIFTHTKLSSVLDILTRNLMTPPPSIRYFNDKSLRKLGKVFKRTKEKNIS